MAEQNNNKLRRREFLGRLGKATASIAAAGCVSYLLSHAEKVK